MYRIETERLVLRPFAAYIKERSVLYLALILFAGCTTMVSTREKEGRMYRIETERLVLRPFAANDWKDFQELSVDWMAAPGPAFDKWPTSDEDSRGSVQYMSTRDNFFAVCLRGSGKVIGFLAINGVDEEKQADLGHVILSKYQDNDHDREALRAMVQHIFDVRGAQSIITRNASEHAAQVAPLKSLDFVASLANPGELVISKEQWERRQ
jgi:RimJ/RimL family protein N-acetyltransferase